MEDKFVECDDEEYDDMENEVYWMKNRDKKMKPKKALFYCGCDLNMISPGGRCDVCGYKDKPTKLKKDTNA